AHAPAGRERGVDRGREGMGHVIPADGRADGDVRVVSRAGMNDGDAIVLRRAGDRGVRLLSERLRRVVVILNLKLRGARRAGDDVEKAAVIRIEAARLRAGETER